jgi:hypothetical protein
VGVRLSVIIFDVKCVRKKVGVQVLLDSLGPGVEFARRCLVEFTFSDRLGRSFGDAPLARARLGTG